MQQSSISYSWRKRDAARGFACGVSLHGHTCMSKKTLKHAAETGAKHRLLRPVFANGERRCRETHGFELDFHAAYWTPPMPPRMAYDLERRQIEEQLQLPALVSLTDHDDIRAPMELRSIWGARAVPMSVEWTVPYRDTVFHLGIHNLPRTTADAWMRVFKDFTATPSAIWLEGILGELHSMKNVLIVFNHPAWDVNKVGAERHMFCVNEFLAANNGSIHAMELNGLRSWQENRQVHALAQKWGQLLIGGGDRHGAQPNAITNLTHAASFEEFVHEVRQERVSHIHFMASYAVPCKYRILESTLDALRHYPELPEGSRNWDERVFHPDANGVMRPISQLWPGNGRAPVFVRSVLGGVRLLGLKPLSSSLQLAWQDRQGLRLALG
jgi:hypothetical protein